MDFPLSLQNKKPLFEDFNIQYGQSKIETTTSSGVLLSRKRPVKNQDALRVAYHFNKAELDVFNEFYETTIDQGTKSFTFTHPIKLNEITVKIIGAPQITLLGPFDYKVQIGLIIESENS